jgi:integral membrane protein
MTLTTEQVLWAKRFRLISMIEGLSFLILLFVAMPLKYLYDLPLAVTYVGWIHGILFVIYILVVFPTARKLNWNFSRSLFALIVSVLPFGPYIFNKNLKKEQQIDF